MTTNESDKIYRKAFNLEVSYAKALRSGNPKIAGDMKKQLDSFWDSFYRESRKEYQDA